MKADFFAGALALNLDPVAHHERLVEDDHARADHAQRSFAQGEEHEERARRREGGQGLPRSGHGQRASPRAVSAASLNRGGYDALLSIEEGSSLRVSTDFGLTNTDIIVRDGITVIAPDQPDAMAAMGSTLSGGYPGGVIVLAGETAPGQHQAVFVDPSALTLAETN